MGIFIGVYLVIIAFSFLEINIKAVRFGSWRIDVRKASFWVCTVIIILLGTLKNEYLGVDAVVYEQNYFEPTKYRAWIEIITGSLYDKGFHLLTKALTFISGDYWIYNALLYIIIFAIEAYVIYKNSEYPAVSYLVFTSLGLAIFNYSLLRQAVAVSICFYAFHYVKEKRPIKFVLCTLVAASFHQTALLYLVAYPVANWNIKGYAFWKKCILFIGALIATRFMPILFEFYIKQDYSQIAIAGEGYYLLLYFIVLIAFVAWLMSKNQMKKEGTALYNLLFCIIYFQIGATAFSLLTRVTNYFYISLILIVPFIIRRVKSKNVILAIFIVAMAFRYLLVINGEEYISIWG